MEDEIEKDIDLSLDCMDVAIECMEDTEHCWSKDLNLLKERRVVIETCGYFKAIRQRYGKIMDDFFTRIEQIDKAQQERVRDLQDKSGQASGENSVPEPAREAQPEI